MYVNKYYLFSFLADCKHQAGSPQQAPDRPGVYPREAQHWGQRGPAQRASPRGHQGQGGHHPLLLGQHGPEVHRDRQQAASPGRQTQTLRLQTRGSAHQAQPSAAGFIHSWEAAAAALPAIGCLHQTRGPRGGLSALPRHLGPPRPHCPQLGGRRQAGPETEHQTQAPASANASGPQAAGLDKLYPLLPVLSR